MDHETSLQRAGPIMLAALKESERTLANRPAFYRIWLKVRAAIATAEGRENGSC